jgi:hypothetical protein
MLASLCALFGALALIATPAFAVAPETLNRREHR